MPGFPIVGSSPEMLVRLRDGKVTIRPIAGTRPRGKTPEEDKALAEELMADPKERAEHLMLVDLGRNDVGRVAKTGAVKVTGSFFIERYSHVMHLVSNVEGDIRDGLDAVDALAAGLPAGTLIGRAQDPRHGDHRRIRKGKARRGLCRRGGLFRRRRLDGHLHRAAHRAGQGRHHVCPGGRRRGRRQRARKPNIRRPSTRRAP